MDSMPDWARGHIDSDPSPIHQIAQTLGLTDSEVALVISIIIIIAMPVAVYYIYKVIQEEKTK